jgi:hypothetical protein
MQPWAVVTTMKPTIELLMSDMRPLTRPEVVVLQM